MTSEAKLGVLTLVGILGRFDRFSEVNVNMLVAATEALNADQFQRIQSEFKKAQFKRDKGIER